jgi:hypothetical protein
VAFTLLGNFPPSLFLAKTAPTIFASGAQIYITN